MFSKGIKNNYKRLKTILKATSSECNKITKL